MSRSTSAFYSNTFLIFTMRLFPSLAGVLVVAMYSRWLPGGEYGRYSYFWMVLNMLYPLACFGLHLLILNYPKAAFFQLSKAAGSGKRVLYFVWMALIAAVFSAVQLIANGIPPFLSGAFFLVYALGFVFESLLITASRFRVLVFINLLYSTVYVLIHIYWARWAAFSVLHVFAWLFVIVFARTSLYYFAVLPILKSGSDTSLAPDVSRAGKLMMHLGLYDVIQSASLWIDKAFVAVIFTPAVFASYMNGAMNIPFLPLLLSAAGSAVLVQLSTNPSHAAASAAPALLQKTGRLLSCFVFPVFFFLLVNNTDVVRLLYGSKYDAAIPVFTVSLFVLPVRAYNFTSILQQQHLGRVINKGAIGEIVIALLLMYPLYSLIGIAGFALSFVISTYLQGGYYLYQTARALQVSIWQLIPATNWLIKFVIAGALALAVKTIAGYSGNVQITLISGGFAMLLFSITTLLRERNIK